MRVSGYKPGGNQSGHLDAEANHRLAVLDKIIGVGHPIALDVGGLCIFGIWPPIIALREKVVLPACAPGAASRSDCDWYKLQIGRCGAYDANPVDRRHISFRRPECKSRQGEQGSPF